MRKQFLWSSAVIISVVLLCISVFSVNAVVLKSDCYNDETNITWTYNDDKSLVVEGNGAIPSFSDYTSVPYFDLFEAGKVAFLTVGSGITGIGDYAFYSCSAETVEIGSDVRSIGDFAFYGMNNAKNINIPSTVRTIGENAFSCSPDITVNVDSKSQYFVTDEYGILYNYSKTEVIFCPSGTILTDYRLPETVTTIRDNAFNGAENLKSITFPNTLKYVGENAFKGCSSLETVILNYGLESIGTGAFNNCEKISDIYYRGSEESLSDISMSDCGLNKEDIVCYYCQHGNTVQTEALQPSCNSPGYTEGIFCEDCGTFVVGREFVTETHSDKNGDSICDVCYEEYCQIVDIGFCCDSNCSVLWALYDNGSLHICGLGEMKNYCEYGTPFYKYSDTVTKVTVGEGVTAIGDNAFSGFYSLKTVNGGNNVKRIGESAFENAVFLETVNGFTSLEVIEDSAFKNCALSNFNFGSALKTIGYESFYSCRFENVKIPGFVENIGGRAFHSCTAMQEFFIGKSVISIGENAFGNCNSLTEFTVDGFNSRFCSVGGVLFDVYCIELIRYPAALAQSAYRVPDTVKKISYGAFSDCKNLTYVKLNEGLASIGDYAFSSCSSISDVDIPSGVEKIGNGAFSYCSSLCNLNFENSDITVGEFVFCYCTNLKEVILPDGITKIPLGTFYHCSGLEKITFGASIEKIEKSAFSFCKNLKIVLCEGNEESFGEIDIKQDGNECFISAPKHFSDHTFTKYEQVPPICVYNGYTEGILCNECRYWLSGHKVIEAEFDDHSLGEYNEFIASTCTQKGENRAYCLRGCGYYVSESAQLKAHDYTPNVTEPTCVQGGYIVYECCCGNSYTSDFTEKVGHTLSDYRTVSASSCAVAGIERATCKYCTYHVERSLPLLSHTYTAVLVNPTCTQQGYTEYRCSCGYSYRGLYTAASGHSMSDYITVSASSCTVTGKQRATCTKCGYYLDRNLPLLSHNYTSTSVVNSTCSSDGYTLHRCSCGNSYRTDIKSALGHYYSAYFTTDRRATCTSIGSKSRHCVRCTSKIDVTAIPMLSHSYSSVITPATFTNNGKEIKICSVCGKVHSTSTVNKIKTVNLSTTSYAYDGRAKSPLVTVKDSKGISLVKGSDYTVSYQSGRVKAGAYNVTVTFKGKYSGKKVVTFRILPQNVKTFTAKPAIKSVTLSWKKAKGATGYRIYYYNAKTKKYVAIRDTSNLSYKVTKINGTEIKSGNDYKFAVRAYCQTGDKKVFASGMKKLATSTKPTKAIMKSAVYSSGKIVVKWNKLACDGYELVYATNKSFSNSKKVDIKKGSAVKKTLKGIKRKQTYYIKIRGYKIIDGEKAYGYYSDTKKIRVR